VRVRDGYKEQVRPQWPRGRKVKRLPTYLQRAGVGDDLRHAAGWHCYRRRILAQPEIGFAAKVRLG
jgi:hypothetical protein